VCVIISVIGCQKEKIEEECAAVDETFTVIVPDHFPPLPVPADNPLTEARVELGRRLFFDTRMSRNNTISCATCHLQSAAFTDNLAVSVGMDGLLTERNAPSLGNVAYQPRLFAEGGVPNLEIQVLAPIAAENEFDHDVVSIEADLQLDDVLNELSLRAFNRPIDIFTITRSLASFQRTMITGNSRYDQYLTGQVELNESELRGLELFFSDELNCSTCHNGHNFTDGDYHNIGLEEVYADEGRFRITSDENDKGKFKTPSLRNIEKTAPYMHNGSIETLEQVIEHFNTGGLGHQNQSPLVESLSLTDQDKLDLISFLNSLTDESFLNNPEFGPLE